MITDPRCQAHDAGLKLRSLLRPDDTLHFFTSPYRRTRETTEGILSSLTSSDPSPSPFPRHTIKVYEEPRLREQDFGNFQPCSAEMSRMWQERADYGHFFYRIPDGESAADAYDRISGFNESLWRSFGEDSFASVCVLVTHGLMTRVFLMKWYHFSVEYFEDLRNVNHCEFVVMKLNEGNGKYELKNQLRTWSELRREKEREQERQEGNAEKSASPVPVRKRWGGCADGCEHDGSGRRANVRRQNTADLFIDEIPSPPRGKIQEAIDEEGDKDQDEYPGGVYDAGGSHHTENGANGARNSKGNGSLSKPSTRKNTLNSEHREIQEAGRDGGGSQSGAVSRSGTPLEDDDALAKEHMNMLPVRGSMAMALKGELDGIAKSTRQYRARADTLGDQSDVDDDTEEIQEIKRQEIADKSVEGSVF